MEQSVVCLFVCSFVCLFVCSFVRSFVRLFVCSLFVCLFAREDNKALSSFTPLLSARLERCQIQSPVGPTLRTTPPTGGEKRCR